MLFCYINSFWVTNARQIGLVVEMIFEKFAHRDVSKSAEWARRANVLLVAWLMEAWLCGAGEKECKFLDDFLNARRCSVLTPLNLGLEVALHSRGDVIAVVGTVCRSLGSHLGEPFEVQFQKIGQTHHVGVARCAEPNQELIPGHGRPAYQTFWANATSLKKMDLS